MTLPATFFMNNTKHLPHAYGTVSVQYKYCAKRKHACCLQFL